MLASLVMVLGSASTAQARPGVATWIHGTGISRLPDDTRKLTINAHTAGEPTAATGFVHFTHQSPIGLSRFRAAVSCLSVENGTVEVSGTVLNGVTATGLVLTGRDFAMTIFVDGDSTSFTLPRFGPAGTIEPCSGGRTDVDPVPVTQAGFQLR